MTPDTVFALHSMTKPITSLAAMMLVDEGKLSLTDPLSRYIPAFAAAKVAVVSKAGDGAADVTLTLPNRAPDIEDLLRHTSGIGNGDIGAKAIREIYEKPIFTMGSLATRYLPDAWRAFHWSHNQARFGATANRSMFSGELSKSFRENRCISS